MRREPLEDEASPEIIANTLLLESCHAGCRVSVVAVLLCAAMSLRAAVPDSVAHQLLEVGVQGSRPSEAVMATKPFQQLGRREMGQLGLATLADAVRLFVGTEVRDYGGIGGMKTVSVRSLGAHHTAVSYDGLTQSNTQAGQIDIGRFQTDDVEAVAVAVGAPDDLLQTARHYASAGVLCISTQQPHFQPGSNHSLRVGIRSGSFGLVNPFARYWQRLGRRTALSGYGAWLRSDGRYPFTLINGRTRSREKRQNTDMHAWQAEVNLYHTFADSSRLSIKGRFDDSGRGLPGAVILYNPFSDDRLRERDGFAQALYHKTFSPRWALRTGLKYTHTSSRFEGTNAVYPGGIQQDHSRQQETYATATVCWTPRTPLAIALAQDVALNTLSSNIYVNTNLDVPNPVRLTSLTALTARLRLSRWQADAGLVGTYATEHVEAGPEPPVRRHLSPTLSASYRLLPNHSLFLRAMLKHTFRLPSFNDTYYRRMGNPHLRPERAHEYNIGVTWHGHPARWLRYLSLTADAYYNRVTDKIVAFPAAYVWRMANFGKVNVFGADVTLASDIPLGSRFSMGLTAGYTAQRAVDADQRSATYHRQLPYTPRHHGSVSALLHSLWVDLGYTLCASSSRYSSAQNLSTERLKAYAEHTLTASRSLHLRKADIDLSITARNLTAAHYEIIQYYPMPGRSFEGKASVTF